MADIKEENIKNLEKSYFALNNGEITGQNNNINNSNFSFIEGDKVEMIIDGAGNILQFFNKTTKQELNIVIEQGQFPYSVALLFNQGKIDGRDQIELECQDDIFECPICLVDSNKNSMVITECLHQICVDCYNNLIQRQFPQCPYCKWEINDKEILVHPRHQKIQESKIGYLFDSLKKTPKEDKVIIFTQFEELKMQIIDQLEKQQVGFTILKGEPSEINIRINKFKNIPETKVLVMSIEQAASGLNLQVANHMYFVHPIFMERDLAIATYLQCLGRIVRYGQLKNVNSTIFITKDSIEEDVLPYYQDSYFNEK